MVSRLGHRGCRWSLSPIPSYSLALIFVATLLAPTLAQAATPGALDRSFGDDGWARTRIGAHDEAAAVAIDSKHRIVVAGSATYRHLFAVARYRPSGRLDRSFSGNGKKTTRFSGGPGYVVSHASSVAIDSRDRIVAAGTKCNWTAPPRHVDADLIGCEIAVARYRRSGRLDRSFGRDGRVTFKYLDVGATSVAIDAKDRIIVAGTTDVIARFRHNGTLDRSFGAAGGGLAFPPTYPAYNYAYLTSLAIDSRGRIVAVGYVGGYRFLVVRFLPNGRPDRSFGNGGKVIGHNDAFALSVAITAKDQVLAAGGAPGATRDQGGFRLALYRPDGTRARHWGDNGEITTAFRNLRHHHRDSVAVSVGFDSRKRIAAIGQLRHEYALARYHRNGTLDRSFSGNGKAKGLFRFPRRREPGYVLAGTLDHRDRIVVAGAETRLQSRFLLARFAGYRRR